MQRRCNGDYGTFSAEVFPLVGGGVTFSDAVPEHIRGWARAPRSRPPPPAPHLGATVLQLSIIPTVQVTLAPCRLEGAGEVRYLPSCIR